MKLIIIRHGQTEQNEKGIYQGQTQGKLTQKGKEQAKKLAKRLEKEKIDLIYCSDLQRTKDTIKPFLEQKNIPIHYVTALRERSFGVVEGLKRKQVEEYLTKNKIKHYGDSNFETGETFDDMWKRISNFYNILINKHQEGNILLVTHGGLIKQMLVRMFDHPDIIPDNTSVTEIEIKDKNPKLLIFNDTSHL